MANNISEMIRESLGSIRGLADSNTVVGEPIPTNNGTVIIPVSKVTVGYASGGVDYLPKKDGKKDPPPQTKAQGKMPDPCFGGGGGTGIAVTPVCFLVVSAEGNVSILNITSPAAVSSAVGTIDSISNFADKAPEILGRIKDVFSKKAPESRLDDDTLASMLDEDAL